MIQRIQTVYLFFTFCLMAILVFFPFWTKSSLVGGFIIGLTLGVAFGTFVNIFSYKKRQMQIKTCYVLLVMLGLIYAIYFIFERDYLPLSEFFQQVRFTFVFPLVAAILLYLAIRGIKKDEKLIRSLDRLR